MAKKSTPEPVDLRGRWKFLKTGHVLEVRSIDYHLRLCHIRVNGSYIQLTTNEMDRLRRKGELQYVGR